MESFAENRLTITKNLFYERVLRVSTESDGKLAGKAAALLGGMDDFGSRNAMAAPELSGTYSSEAVVRELIKNAKMEEKEDD